jgi:hypothetical protein
VSENIELVENQKPHPEPAWQKWEPVIHEILGGTSGRFLDDHSGEKQKSDGSKDSKESNENKEGTTAAATVEYFDRNGRKVLNPKELPANEAVLSIESDSSESRTLKVFADRAGFQANKEILSENFTYRQDSNKTIEHRKIKGSDFPETELQVTYDKVTSGISFSIKSDGLKQEIELDGNSKPHKFEIGYGDNLLSYQIEDGKFSGVKVTASDGANRPLSAEKTAEFIAAANQSVESLRLNNGIPEPLSFASKDAPFRIESGELNLAEDAYMRRQVVTPELFNSLLSDAKNNDVAKSILVDLSTPDYFRADPLSAAIKTLKERHPEKSEVLSDAAIDSLRMNSRDPLHQVLGKAATEDPVFADNLRQIAGSVLRSERADSDGLAVEVLMSMSSNWTTADFNEALRRMQPDQIREFRAALNQAPLDVKQEAVRIATMNQSEQNRDFFNLPNNLASSQNMLLKDEFRSTQDRMRLIIGQNELGQSLLPLPLVSRLDQRLIDKPAEDKPSSFLDRPPSFLDFAALGKDRQMNHVSDLFRSAFPHHEMLKERRQPNLDTRYLADSLTAHTLDRSGPPQTADNVFSKWGIDSQKFADKIDAAVTQYGQDNLLSLDRRVQMFNALDAASRERLAGAGNGDRVDEGKLAGLVLNGRLGQSESPYSFLLNTPPLEQKLEQNIGAVTSDLRLAELNLRGSRDARDVSLGLLSQYTSDGVGAGALVTHGLDKTFEAVVAIPTFGLAPKTDLFTSGVEAFAKKQGELVEEFRANQQAFKDKLQETANLNSGEAILRFGKTVLDYESLAQSATPQIRKDYMALSLVDRYGMDVIKDKAPRVWQDLQDGGLKRLLDKQLIQSDKFDEITGSRGDRLEQAFKISDSLRQNDTGNLDLGIRRRQVLDVIDSDPSLNRAQKQFSEFGQEFATFSKLVESAKTGTKYEDIVKDLKTQAKELEHAIGQVKREDLNNLIDLQLKTESASRSATDPETRAALEERAKSMRGLLDILDPKSPQNQSLLETLKDVQTRSFSEDTLGTWLKDNGPVIAAAAVSVSITLATMGTGAPIAAVLISSAVALGATQVTSEALYQINHNLGDTGFGAYDSRSYAGAWSANNAESFNRLLAAQDWKGTSESAQSLISSFVKEVSVPLTADYAQNVVMGLVGLGALKVGQSGISSVNAQWVKSLVSNPQSLEMIELAGRAGMNSSSKAAAASWMRQLAKESAKEVGEEIGQEGVTTVAERALQQAKLNSPLASTLLAVSMGLAQGRLGSNHNSGAKFTSDNDMQIHSSMRDSVLENLKNSGHLVEKQPDGSFKVSDYKTPGSELRISLSDDVHMVSNHVETEQAIEPEPSRRHSRHGLGVENNTDVKIQNLSDQLELASPEESAKIKSEIKEILVEKAQEYARKLGLVVTDDNGKVVDYLISEKNIRLTNEGFNDSYGTDNTIEINLNRTDPTSALLHEMKHMSEMLERTSLEKADPEMFDRRIREDVFGELAQGGGLRIAEEGGEQRTVPRTELKTIEQKSALRSLLMEFSETNSSSSPEQIAEWLRDKPEQVQLFAQDGLDSAALTKLMSAEMYHYRAVKREAQLDSDVLQNDVKLDQWTTARAENYRRMAERRGDTIYDEPQLHKLTRAITEEALGIMGNDSHYNVFGPSERRAEVLELSNAIKALKSDSTSQGIVESNVSVIQHSVNLQKLTSSLAKMRADGSANPQVLQDARDAASKVIDKLPETEMGRQVVARMLDLQLIDVEQVPAFLRPVGDGAEYLHRISDSSSEANTGRRLSQENPVTRHVLEDRAGKSSAVDIELLRDGGASVMVRKRELDLLDEQGSRTAEQDREYDVIMNKLDAHRALRKAVDSEMARLEETEKISQSELTNTTQGGFATQKLVTNWVKDLFAGDPRYKVLEGGATSDHYLLDMAVFDTKTGQYLPVQIKQYVPDKALPSLVRLAKADPHDEDLQGHGKESAKEANGRRQKLFFQDLAGAVRNSNVSLGDAQGAAKQSLLFSLRESPLTVLHNPLALQNHLSAENMRLKQTQDTIDSLKSLPRAEQHRAAVKLEAELSAQKRSVEKFIGDLESQAKTTNNHRLTEYAGSFRHIVQSGGYFDRAFRSLERITKPPAEPATVMKPILKANPSSNAEAPKHVPIDSIRTQRAPAEIAEPAKSRLDATAETPNIARLKVLSAVFERSSEYGIKVGDQATYDSDLKEVLQELVDGKIGNFNQLQLAEAKKLHAAYVQGNSEGIDRVHAFLRRKQEALR